jgi:minor extracellular protease Epr
MRGTGNSALLRWLIAIGIIMAAPMVVNDGNPGSPAFAQEDDDDDDDDDDDSGGGGGGGGSGGGTGAGSDDDDAQAATRKKRPRGEGKKPRRVVAAAPEPGPERAPDEIVVVDLTPADLASLIARGYQVIETRTNNVIAAVSHRLRVPSGTALEAARDEVRSLASGSSADFNHYYRTDQSYELAAGPACQGPQCAAFQLVGLRTAADVADCGVGARIGLIDTGINPDHETFAQGRLTILSVVPDDLPPSRSQHGTAVAAILIGDPASRSPGLVPEADVIAVDAFHLVGQDERSDVFSLVGAMDQLALEGVDVVNMSLSGPPNVVLEQMVMRFAERGIVIVAAAGNEGPKADPLFPGAYAPVLTVTAVDSRGDIYRRAGQGPHVDLAAPGVDVWTAASVKGARGKTGTSFAAPFVTAAVAMLMARNEGMTVAEVTEVLTETALDLGAPGPDEVFGAGLLQIGSACDGLPMKSMAEE